MRAIARVCLTARRLTGASLLLACSGCAGRSVESLAVAPPSSIEARCVAVLPFDNTSGVSNAGRTFAALVSDELVVSSRFSVLEPDEASRILDAVGMPRTASVIDPQEASRYGQALGVEGVIIGSVGRSTERAASGYGYPDYAVVDFTVRWVDVRSGEVIWATTASAFDDPVLLALPRSPHQMAKLAVTRSLAPLIETNGSPGPPAEVCWKALPAMSDRGLADLLIGADDVHALVRAGPGDTVAAIAQRLLLSRKHEERVFEANPGLVPMEPLRAGTVVRVPRFLEHTAIADETAASVAEAELGHRAFAVLVQDANPDLFRADAAPPGPSSPGVVVDATQHFNVFDVIGSVQDMFVVVNGVPAILPRARVLLRWLVYGRKLPMKGRRPAEEPFFEVSAEAPEYVKKWRVVIRTAEGKVVRTLDGEGPPPARVTWDGLLDGGSEMTVGAVYQYQLEATYNEGTEVRSAIEAFGAGTQAQAARTAPFAVVKNKSMEVRGGRFAERLSTGTYSGVLAVSLGAADGSTGTGSFLVPSVTVIRPHSVEMLEVGASNETYTFPSVPIVDGRIDVRDIDAVDISFVLTGQTESGNEILLDGLPLEVGPTGSFETTLHLRRGNNLFSILARAPDGSQTFMAEQIVLRTRGPDREPWEYAPAGLDRRYESATAPLPPGATLKIPLLRVQIDTSTSR